jgi:phosphopantothenoylcysteine decarboxylase/phosphopantothenate--cysteine ligase
MNEFQGKRVVLGVTGGVAAYKAAELVRLLVKAGAETDVVLTAAGAQFVGPATFQALSGRRVWQALWDERMDNGMAHIDLTRGAAACWWLRPRRIFLPSWRTGFADDLLSTLCLARDCPLLVAPAMNRQMWENPATQRNVAQLRTDGVSVLGPGHGDQACGEVGDGRMLEAAGTVRGALHAALQAKSLAGKRVLLTAGPTFEALDPVRGPDQFKLGKMGFALARACAEAAAPKSPWWHRSGVVSDAARRASG